MWESSALPRIGNFPPAVESASAAGVRSVQSGTQAMSSAAVNVTIASVTTSRAFVLCNNRTNLSDATNRVRCDLTGPTTLTITTGAANATNFVSWQVIEFATGVSVQRGTQTFATADTSFNVTIASAATANSFDVIS